jgi:hypothetical protein
MTQTQKPQSVHGGFAPEVLTAIYTALNAVQLDYNERKWGTVRASSTLTLGVLAAIGGLAASDAASDKWVLRLLAVTLVALGSAIFWWARRNILRESALQYHAQFPMYQIEKLLGVHEKIPDNLRWLPNAEYIFGPKHLSYKFRSEIVGLKESDDPINDWVDGRLKHHMFIDTVGGFSLILFVVCVWVGVTLWIISNNLP